MSKKHGGKRPGAGRPKLNGGAQRVLITISETDLEYIKSNFDGVSQGVRALVSHHRQHQQGQQAQDEDRPTED